MYSLLHNSTLFVACYQGGSSSSVPFGNSLLKTPQLQRGKTKWDINPHKAGQRTDMLILYLHFSMLILNLHYSMLILKFIENLKLILS